MQITIASRGSPDYTAGRALVRSHHRPFFAVEAEARPDCVVVARRPDRPDRLPSACAALTFADRAPLLSERRLGRSIESVIGAREGRVVERCTIVEIDALASDDAAAEDALVRALPMLAWCLGRQYAICRATRRLREPFDRIGTRFVMLRADRTARRGDRPDPSPVLGYTRTATVAPELTSNTASGTGHYCFDEIVVPVSTAAARGAASAGPVRRPVSA